MSGQMPDRYRRRLLTREVIEGIDHHWVWSPGEIHRSRTKRAFNYIGFATVAALRAATLPRPDVLVISSPPLTVAALGPLLAWRFRCPWVLEVRDIWPESAVSVGWLRPEGGMYRILERLAHYATRSADLVVVPTPGLEPLVRAHGAQTVVTLTGAVVSRPEDAAKRAAIRSGLAISDDECLFLYLGAIGMANGLDRLLEAIMLVPADVHARVIVAGDGSARPALARALEAKGLERVSLLPALPRDEVGDLLGAADVGLHLLRPDPVFESALPSKVLDYLGARLPFITTVEGLPRQIALESGGAAAASPAELAAEIARWSAKTPQERRSRGEQALAYGLREFGLDARITQLEGVLSGLLDNRSVADTGARHR
jgi:glycosyltransferase involved in cell wall biosynthesis